MSVQSPGFQDIYRFVRVIVDCPTSVFGEHLKTQVEDRLKFYESGEAPKKNADVMKVAVKEVCTFMSLIFVIESLLIVKICC